MIGSALFLQLCPASKSPTTLVVFGSGAQAHSHASIFVRTFPSITKVTFAVRSINERATSLVDNLKKSLSGVDISLQTTSGDEAKGALKDVVRAANIIVTVTASTEPLFPSEWVSPDTRLILVGAYTPKMKEIDVPLVKRAGIIVVDSIEACGHEAGDLLQAHVKDEDLVELGTIVGKEKARSTVGKGGDVAIFKSVSRNEGRLADETGRSWDPGCGYNEDCVRCCGSQRAGDEDSRLRFEAVEGTYTCSSTY